MRRTRERFLTNPSTARGLSSSLLLFEGEDLDFRNRARLLQKTHKEIFDQQIKEKRALEQSSRQKDLQQHQAYLEMNSLFGRIEEDYRLQYRHKLQEIKNANMKQAKAKREQMTIEKRSQIEEDNKLFSELNRRRSVSTRPNLISLRSI